MKRKILSLGVASAIGFAMFYPSTIFAASTEPEKLEQLAREAVSGDCARADDAIKKLRVSGPDGLDAMLRIHAKTIAEHSGNWLVTPQKKSETDWPRLRAALDAVAQQRDVCASHLFWFTDLDAAKTAAKTTGKPILSLRLLGKLDEEFSCANSRFFRTTLYPNAKISRYLRDNFILHWKSVRPVPRVTIDFGDGRKLERTITGNSIHYILDSDGRTIDALPGLYGPESFLRGLEQANEAAKNSGSLSENARTEFLRKYHSDRLAAINQQWVNDFAKINPAAPAPTLTKIFSAPDSISDATWKKIAALHFNEARLDAGALTLIGVKRPLARDAARMAVSKSVVENPMLRMTLTLQNSIAEDSVRNEYLLHARIHQWLASGAAPDNLDRLNAKIYAELFLTPETDPWLGLAPADAFAALENNGVVQPIARVAN